MNILIKFHLIKQIKFKLIFNFITNEFNWILVNYRHRHWRCKIVKLATKFNFNLIYVFCLNFLRSWILHQPNACAFFQKKACRNSQRNLIYDAKYAQVF